MASRPTIEIAVTADTKSAQKSLQDMGQAADKATSQTRSMADGVDSIGSKSAQVTTGLRDLGGALSEAGGAVGALGTAMETGAIAFEAIDGAATLYTAATSTMAAAQTAAAVETSFLAKAMNFLKVSILTNPIFIIAAIIIAIGAALVIAYQKSETFRAIVDAAFKVVSQAIQVAWEWIKKLAAIIGDALVDAWSIAKSAASKFFDIVTAPIRTLIGLIEDVVGWISRIKWPSPPAWLSSIGDAIGLTATPAGATTVGTMAATPRVGTRSAAPPGGVVININGALDPDGVARQIRRVLGVNDRRTGRAYMAAS